MFFLETKAAFLLKKALDIHRESRYINRISKNNPAGTERNRKNAWSPGILPEYTA